MFEPLGRDVDQLELARVEPARALAALCRREVRGEVGGRDPALLERADLILHQRDQRADDDGRTDQLGGGELIAERLAPTGRRDGEHPPRALEQRGDRLALPRTKVREAEALDQRVLQTIFHARARAL